jgi:hypothetical protein
MVARAIGVAVLAVVVTAVLPQTPPAFDPVGKWAVTTTNDGGAPMTVTVDIAGKPGAYTGQAVTSENRTLPLGGLATMPDGMIAFFDLPQGAIVVKLVRDPSGKYVGAWGEVEAVYPLSAVKR